MSYKGVDCMAHEIQLYYLYKVNAPNGDQFLKPIYGDSIDSIVQLLYMRALIWFWIYLFVAFEAWQFIHRMSKKIHVKRI